MSSITKPVIAIIGNENSDDSGPWISACLSSKTEVDFDIIDLTANDWQERISARNYDLLLARPGGITAHFKQLYDERIYILGQVLNYKIFPSSQEIFIYENKRLLSYWLKANNIASPQTDVFYHIEEAIRHLSGASYPFIAKTNIGASGSGVSIINNRKEGLKYLEKTFYGKGSPQRTGPNFKKGKLINRGINYLLHPSEITKKLGLYRNRAHNLQKNFVIFQEFVHHDFEWRIVRIGDSFFAHKKVVKNGKASGTLIKKYEDPPLQLLDFAKELTDKHALYSLAIDVFESERGYLVNELQCFFGQSDPYQMIVGGEPGRYVSSQGKWIFEPGDFASNMCYDLRLETAISNLSESF